VAVGGDLDAVDELFEDLFDDVWASGGDGVFDLGDELVELVGARELRCGGAQLAGEAVAIYGELVAAGG
jgi:hypothetical protein